MAWEAAADLEVVTSEMPVAVMPRHKNTPYRLFTLFTLRTPSEPEEASKVDWNGRPGLLRRSRKVRSLPLPVGGSGRSANERSCGDGPMCARQNLSDRCATGRRGVS